MKQTLLLILICLSTATVSAEEMNTATTLVLETKTTEPEEQPATILNRAEKKFSVSAGIVDPIQLGVYGMTFSGGYFLNRDTVLEINYLNRIEDRSFSPQIEQTSWVLQVKRFVWGGIYLGAGINQTEVSYANKYILRDEFAHSFKGNVTAASLVMGVEHHEKNFKWGFEGFGYMQPLSHSVSSEFLAQDSDTDLRSAQSKYLKESRMTMARLYVGASF